MVCPDAERGAGGPARGRAQGRKGRRAASVARDPGPAEGAAVGAATCWCDGGGRTEPARVRGARPVSERGLYAVRAEPKAVTAPAHDSCTPVRGAGVQVRVAPPPDRGIECINLVRSER